MSMNEVGIVRVRNVAQALESLRSAMQNPRRDYYWRDVSPRGMQTMEWRGPFVTEYQNPTERVLFSPHRDANPFFHLMESLWILAGRADVDFLAQYNKRMRQYSDNGVNFHAPYGYRLRNHFLKPVDEDGEELFAVDQISEAVKLLRADHATRQVVMSIWDPAFDLGAKTKDMPCNDMIMLKVREHELNMTVCCRSNDAIWGAYGANAVQFSMLQEFIASAVGVQVGPYRQISDSFHVYTDQETWLNVLNSPAYRDDPYARGIQPFPLFTGFDADAWPEWLKAAEEFCEGKVVNIPFFVKVAAPMRDAWHLFRRADIRNPARQAHDFLRNVMADCDWKLAACEWMARRDTGA